MNVILLPPPFIANINPGQTLITAFNNKCRHTLEACSDEGIVFVPVCQELLGGYHERSASVLKRIALAEQSKRY